MHEPCGVVDDDARGSTDADRCRAQRRCVCSNREGDDLVFRGRVDPWLVEPIDDSDGVDAAGNRGALRTTKIIRSEECQSRTAGHKEAVRLVDANGFHCAHAGHRNARRHRSAVDAQHLVLCGNERDVSGPADELDGGHADIPPRKRVDDRTAGRIARGVEDVSARRDAPKRSVVRDAE